MKIGKISTLLFICVCHFAPAYSCACKYPHFQHLTRTGEKGLTLLMNSVQSIPPLELHSCFYFKVWTTVMCKSINPQCSWCFKFESSRGRGENHSVPQYEPISLLLPLPIPDSRALDSALFLPLSPSRWCCCPSSTSPHEIPSLQHPVPVPGSFPKCRDPQSAPGRGRGSARPSKAVTPNVTPHVTGCRVPPASTAGIPSITPPQNGGCSGT